MKKSVDIPAGVRDNNVMFSDTHHTQTWSAASESAASSLRDVCSALLVLVLVVLIIPTTDGVGAHS